MCCKDPAVMWHFVIVPSNDITLGQRMVLFPSLAGYILI